MVSIATTSPGATDSPLKRLISGHPLTAYFILAFVFSWIPILPLTLSRNVGIGLLPYNLPDIVMYMLLALTIVVGLPLANANAVKSAALVPVTLVAMAVFAYKGNIDWTLGAIMGVGSIAGGILGAKLTTAPQARRWIFWLLVVVIGGELIHLFIHYVFKTF